jgi:hypothetical protein
VIPRTPSKCPLASVPYIDVPGTALCTLGDSHFEVEVVALVEGGDRACHIIAVGLVTAEVFNLALQIDARGTAASG